MTANEIGALGFAPVLGQHNRYPDRGSGTFQNGEWRLRRHFSPLSAYSHDGLADVAVAKNDDATAIRHFETSLTLDPDNDYAVRGLARIRERQSH